MKIKFILTLLVSKSPRQVLPEKTVSMKNLRSKMIQDLQKRKTSQSHQNFSLRLVKILMSWLKTGKRGYKIKKKPKDKIITNKLVNKISQMWQRPLINTWFKNSTKNLMLSEIKLSVCIPWIRKWAVCHLWDSNTKVVRSSNNFHLIRMAKGKNL